MKERNFAFASKNPNADQRPVIEGKEWRKFQKDEAERMMDG